MNYHQGDVLLVRVRSIPKDVKFLRKNIVMFGEVTGHKHVLEDCELFESRDGKLFLKNNVLSPMVHDEHPTTAPVEKGSYEVRIQEEYFPDGFRKVQD